jgi:hypothetical protein
LLPGGDIAQDIKVWRNYGYAGKDYKTKETKSFYNKC